MDALGDFQGTAVELGYISCIAEIDNEEVAASELSLVGAGVCGGFTNTNKLKTMKYKEVMKSKDAEAWKVEVGRRRSGVTNAISLLLCLEVNCQMAQKLWPQLG